MGVLKKFEQRLEGLVNGTFAKVFKSEVQPVEIAGCPPARVRQQRDDLEPRADRRPQRLHRGAERAGLRASQPLLGAARRRAVRHGARLREAAALHLHGTDQGPPGEGGRPGHGSVPGTQPHARVELQPAAVPALPAAAAARPGPRFGAPGGGRRLRLSMRRRTLAAGTAIRRMSAPPMPAGPPPGRPGQAPAGARPRNQAGPLPGAQVRHWIEINGTRHQISRPTLVLGRSTEADVRIDDPGVSHAAL